MEHSKKYQNVKNLYDTNMWNKLQVYNAVGRWIRSDEYEEIVGEPYIPIET